MYVKMEITQLEERPVVGVQLVCCLIEATHYIIACQSFISIILALLITSWLLSTFFVSCVSSQVST